MIDYKQRRPDVSVRVVRTDYASSTYSESPVVNFVSHPEGSGTESDALVGYSYEEDVAGKESPFSLTLVSKPDRSGKTFMDLIQPMDLVFIHEFGIDRYCGVVHDIRYSARMTDSGPQRSIVVSGSGLGDLLASFQLVMNYYLWVGGPTSQTAAKQLAIEIQATSGGSLSEILRTIYKNFLKLATAIPDGAEISHGVQTVISKYFDMEKGIPDSLSTRYPLAMRFYQEGVNSIWDIWRSILPQPIYELFGRWEGAVVGGSYRIIARQCPFSPADWKILDKPKIDPLALISYSVGNDDAEVKTFFYATMPGSELSDKEVLAMDQYKAARKANQEKWPKYGYRPMNATFRHFNRSTKEFSTQKVLEEAAALLADWYGENDRFLSGSLSMISPDQPNYPRAGEKIGFLGGEFYLERVAHSWAYGGSPTMELSLTRGFLYSESGQKKGPIPSIGRRLLEFERGDV